MISYSHIFFKLLFILIEEREKDETERTTLKAWANKDISNSKWFFLRIICLYLLIKALIYYYLLFFHKSIKEVEHNLMEENLYRHYHL